MAKKKAIKKPKPVELVDVPIRVDDELTARIDKMASQCGLDRDQMASAIVVIAFNNLLNNEKKKK
jgi:predicted transcriptional regulator